MNKYKILTFVFVLMFSLSSSNAFAQTGTPTTTRNEIRTIRENIENEREETREAIKEKRDEIKDLREEKKEEIKNLREEGKKKLELLKENIKLEKDKAKAKIQEQRINNRIESLERFDKMIENISKNKSRVSEQITKANTLGVDTTSIQTELNKVDGKLAEVKNKVVEMNTLLSKSVNQLTTEEKAKLKTLNKEAQDGIKEAHNYIKNSVKLLKDTMRNYRAQNPTSSKTETNTSSSTQ